MTDRALSEQASNALETLLKKKRERGGSKKVAPQQPMYVRKKVEIGIGNDASHFVILGLRHSNIFSRVHEGGQSYFFLEAKKQWTKKDKSQI